MTPGHNVMTSQEFEDFMNKAIFVFPGEPSIGISTGCTSAGKSGYDSMCSGLLVSMDDGSRFVVKIDKIRTNAT